MKKIYVADHELIYCEYEVDHDRENLKEVLISILEDLTKDSYENLLDNSNYNIKNGDNLLKTVLMLLTKYIYNEEITFEEYPGIAYSDYGIDLLYMIRSEFGWKDMEVTEVSED